MSAISDCHLVVKVQIETVSRVVTNETFNVTQRRSAPELPVRPCLLLSHSEVTEVVLSTNVKVVSSSPIVESTTEGRFEVKVAFMTELKVRVVVV